MPIIIEDDIEWGLTKLNPSLFVEVGDGLLQVNWTKLIFRGENYVLRVFIYVGLGSGIVRCRTIPENTGNRTVPWSVYHTKKALIDLT